MLLAKRKEMDVIPRTSRRREVYPKKASPAWFGCVRPCAYSSYDEARRSAAARAKQTFCKQRLKCRIMRILLEIK
jgi:hypothetical protein